MKFKILLLTAPILTLSARLFAAAPVDSIGVENLDGKKVILHKLDPKETYYSLGRKYNVSPKTIQQFNNNVALRVGGLVKVPTELPFIAPTSQPVVTAPVATSTPQAATPSTVMASTSSDPNVQQYKVSAGETLYSIAKRFNSTVDDIVKLNNLPSSNAVVGQLLKVKLNSATPPPTPQPVIAKRDSNVYTNAQDSINAVKFGANRYGLYEKAEKGIAVSMTDEGLDPSKKLALHATAPVGTVIKITNPMTGKTTFAKVVGRFTESEATKGAIIVVTKNVSDSIGALDKRVQVNISYGVPNE
ncbi:DPBB and LysM peptidoglycan-binding domain-containing protein [Mucilaginibacter auburnensis]|uniref:LysM repeat protein n=1 Tax=Mucilaginibacter auburnensis TaxID=1457233 RepID=A0A2H9VVA6_9SPHI|nr:LysM peptidoglycan-binding domain-containing protein [Mucilaginibacter auburnensis]PJJ84763.1 LysM repeat protein [Mucilaginibacter auburnensis]